MITIRLNSFIVNVKWWEVYENNIVDVLGKFILIGSSGGK